MFSDELVDTRTPKQKKRARARRLPQQEELFKPREVLQFGVTGRPGMPIPEDKHFRLEMQDPRTPEEKRDLQRAAEELTYPLATGDSDLSETPINDPGDS
jgi:hypothetical protein